MIEIIVNGQVHTLSPPATVAALLEQLGFAGKPTLVEHNGQALLARAQGEQTLQAGDRIELIQIVAGG